MKDFIAKFSGSKAAVIALAILLILIALSLVGPLIMPYNPTSQQFSTLQTPSLAHPMGTDDLGRDIFVRVLSGSRLSLAVGLFSVGLALFLGMLAGSISGYIGSFIDALIMRTADIFLAFPYVLGAIALMVVLEPGFISVVIALASFMWASFARMHRSTVLGFKEAEFVQAARLSGAGHTYIITRHILPNSVGPLIVYAATALAMAILGEAILSFIHVGFQAPIPSLGLLINDALPLVNNFPWLMIFPGLFLSLIIGCFILIGEGLRDILDPLTVDR